GLSMFLKILMSRPKSINEKIRTKTTLALSSLACKGILQKSAEYRFYRVFLLRFELQRQLQDTKGFQFVTRAVNGPF
ncbi:hypothetical protein, partial [Ferroacidibacillus organovorans]